MTRMTPAAEDAAAEPAGQYAGVEPRASDLAATPAPAASEDDERADNGAPLATAVGDRPAPGSLGRQLAVLAFDIAAPTGLYYILHGAGVSNLVALSVAAVLPALAAAYKLVVKHQIDAIAVVVLATIALTVALSVVAHDPRFLLARDGLVTGLWGFWFIATLRARRPAAFLFARPLMEGRKVFGTRPWDQLWETDAQFRRIWQVSTVLWALALLIDAVIRVVMAYSLPVDVVPGLGGALWPVTFVLIQVVTNVYYRRAGLYRILGAGWLARH